MKIKQQVFCEHCDNPIDPQDGFIIQGNVYVVTKKSTQGDRSGIIGNNFPEPDENNMIIANQVNEVAWHKDCLIRYLRESLGEILR